MRTPVLLLFGIASRAEAELAQSLGVQGFIARPFALAELVRRVAEVPRQPVFAPPPKWA